MTPTFESFDPTPYQRAPRGNVHRILALARALAKLVPEDAGKTVERKAGVLLEVIEQTADGLTVRRREQAAPYLAAEVEVDGLCDGLWGALRDGLEARRVFEHPGLDTVLAAHGKRSAIGLALRAAKKKAERARVLAHTLFGSEGLQFTQKTFPEQSERMATLLRLIEEDGLDVEIDELLGPEIMVALRATQTEYEGMVGSRMTRTGRKSSDLSVLRGRLQRAIAQYCTAVVTLLDESDPQSLQVVLQALQPIEVFRAGNGSTKVGRRDGSAAEGEEGDEDEEGGDEAKAEAEEDEDQLELAPVG